MKIAKLHKPQRMSNWESVIAYSSEEEENPDELADAEAVALTERGPAVTSQDTTGRITFSIRSPIWIEDAPGPDSTDVDSLRISLTGAGGSGIDIAIPLPVDHEESTAVPQPSPFPMPGEVEYDQFGRPRHH